MFETQKKNKERNETKDNIQDVYNRALVESLLGRGECELKMFTWKKGFSRTLYEKAGAPIQ